MAKANDNEKPVAILSYFVIGIIWYFADSSVQKSAFAKTHVKQALHFFVVCIGISVLWSVLSATIILIPVVVLLAPIVSFGLFILWVLGLINVFNGKKKEIPLIGKWAKKYLTF